MELKRRMATVQCLHVHSTSDIDSANLLLVMCIAMAVKWTVFMPMSFKEHFLVVEMRYVHPLRGTAVPEDSMGVIVKKWGRQNTQLHRHLHPCQGSRQTYIVQQK